MGACACACVSFSKQRWSLPLSSESAVTSEGPSRRKEGGGGERRLGAGMAAADAGGRAELVNHQAEFCCTCHPCNLHLPEFSHAYPEELRRFGYDPNLYYKHVSSLNAYLRRSISCWPGLYVCMLPICWPIGGVLCCKACVDGSRAKENMLMALSHINSELRMLCVAVQWRYYTHETEGNPSTNEGGSTSHHFVVEAMSPEEARGMQNQMAALGPPAPMQMQVQGACAPGPAMGQPTAAAAAFPTIGVPVQQVPVQQQMPVQQQAPCAAGQQPGERGVEGMFR